MIAKKLQISVLITTLFFCFASAAQQDSNSDQSKKQGAKQSGSASKNSSQPSPALQDVETLMDSPDKYNNQKISIKGEVKDKIDSQSFVLESGGIFNDEVIVLMSPELKNVKAHMPKEDSAVTITGTVRMVSIVDLRQELSWDLDPQMEAELQGARVFVVADKIAKK